MRHIDAVIAAKLPILFNLPPCRHSQTANHTHKLSDIRLNIANNMTILIPALRD